VIEGAISPESERIEQRLETVLAGMRPLDGVL